MAHSTQEQLDCALDLMRRLPPAHIEDNLAGLIDLVPHLTESLLSTIDQPLKIAHDAVSKKDYLLCDYNRDGDSYRYDSDPLMVDSSRVCFLFFSNEARLSLPSQLSLVEPLRSAS